MRRFAILVAVLVATGALPSGAAPALTAQAKGAKPGEIITPAAKAERKKENLKAGDAAPDFTLPLLHKKGDVKLSDFQGKKPVVLIFGSYT